MMMKKVSWLLRLLLILAALSKGRSTSLLCGRTKSLELGGGGAGGGGVGGAGAALTLALVRPPDAPAAPDAPSAPAAPAPAAPAPCKLRLSAPNAAAFLVRLIDVKESLLDAELTAAAAPVLSSLAGGAAGAAGAAVAGGKRWSARAATPAQDTAAPALPPAPSANATEPCTLSVYIAEARTPVWRLSLCGGHAAALAARAGTRLLPPRIKVVWAPPLSPFHHTEKLRLVVTAVNSGAICNSSAQFACGALGLCVSSALACDGVAHCPGGEDEAAAACARRRDPPLLDLLRRLAARNQELFGPEAPDAATKPSVIMKIGETEQKTNALKELTEALKPYGPWGYIMLGVLMAATMLMFIVLWECCCSRAKPSEAPAEMPAACVDLAPTLRVPLAAAAAAAAAAARPATPPAYEAPPTYSSLFPRAYKSSPTPVAHGSREPPPD